ncbi:dihydropyrimidinase [Rubrobacter indicoceani]|uniref:dihydropyrimidinase n=1 Tax=Rubrobacter indicoceani TaxID=2051957 RepID=UPI000E5B4F30|nr:dihydropyrimidinase [Rubrobacter indicoceani]
MGRTIFAGGTVVTAEGSFDADVLVEDEKIVAVGTDLSYEVAETIDVSGKLLMPGFIDGHTHMDMPFGGTVTADDWATGTAAALAGGTTTIVDFSLQDVDGSLGDAVDTWHEKARGKALVDYGFHVAITNLAQVKDEISRLPELGVSSIKIFMAYKGTPLYAEDADLFEAMQIAREAGVLVMVHAENGDVVAKLQEQALAAGNTDPVYHALTRPEEAEAEATNRAIQLAEIAGAPLLVVHVSCAAALEPIHRAHELGQTVYAETCPQYFVFSVEDLRKPGFEGAKYVCSPPMREKWNREPLWRGLQLGDLQIFGSDHCAFNFEGQKDLGRNDFTKIPNGCPGAEERAMVLWTHGVLEGRVSENQFVAVLATNQAKVHGLYPRKGMLAPGSDADIVVWDPMLETTATVANRHGNVDYTPYEGMDFHGGPSEVYVRGNLAYKDGDVIAEHGSGRFVERNFTHPAI